MKHIEKNCSEYLNLTFTAIEINEVNSLLNNYTKLLLA